MNHRKLILTALLATTLVGSTRAQSTSGLSKLSVTGVLDYESQYVFRGKKIADSSFEPNADLGYTFNSVVSLHAFVWTNQPIGRDGNHAGPNQTNEIDTGIYSLLALDSLGLKGVTLDTGYQFYWYPDDGGANDDLKTGVHLSDTQEVHVAVKYNAEPVMGAWNINPQVWVYHDFILDSNTLVGSISHTFSLDSVVKGFSIVPSANLGWTKINRVLGDQLPAGRRNWSDTYAFWQANLELDYRLTSYCTLFARLEYSGNNDGTTGGPGIYKDPQTPAAGEHDIWGGVGLSFGM